MVGGAGPVQFGLPDGLTSCFLLHDKKSEQDFLSSAVAEGVCSCAYHLILILKRTRMADESESNVKEDWGDGLSLEGRVQVYPDRSLPDLNGAGGAAFSARFKNDTSQDLMAIICSRGLHPRIDQVTAMRNVDSPSALRLRDYGPVYWPAQNASYFTLVYEIPAAQRFWKTLDETHPVMSEDTLHHTFAIPMIKALLEFQRTGIVHGAIRPTNIFWREGSATPPQIGECLSAPSGIGQPVMFETIERSQCQPIARGIGVHTDDCYAFGVTLVMVILGCNPMQGMDEHAIVRAKMEKGSFNALLGNRRISPSLIELLRGLLSDDAHQRWSAEDLEQWMTGRRLTPKSSDAGRRSTRHFDVAGKEYWQVRPLAAAFAENPAEAAKVIENGSLEKWLIRSLGDEERSKSVSEAVSQLREGGKSAHYQDQLVSRVCIALDPAAPIRYRGYSVMPLGIASVVADAVVSGNNAQIISEIISSQLVTHWVNQQKEVKVDLVPFAQQLERMKTMIEKTSFGCGIERVAYELNPSLPCVSPMLRSECVLSPRFLLPALERIASRGTHPSEPMDRHIAAFLIAREKRTEALFSAMSPSEPPVRRGLALLSLFGEMQYRYGPDQLPKLCAWLMPLVEPCLKRFLSKPFQEKVRRQAKEAVDKGSLSLLLKRVDDPERVSGDEYDFLLARKMYFDIQREMAGIQESMKNKEQIVRDIGRPIAATIASLIALILIAVTLGRFLLQYMR